MSHPPRPYVIEPATSGAPPSVRIAADIGRNYYINSHRHGRSITATANPYPVSTREHEVWFAALLTEAGDHLDILAWNDGLFSVHG